MIALQGRPLRTLALCEASREDVIDSIRQFLSPRNYYQVCTGATCSPFAFYLNCNLHTSPFAAAALQVLIVSYETFRIHVDRMKGEHAW